MKLFVFGIFDTVSGVYDRPVVARSEGEMVRSFKDIASDADHPIGKHPEHFKLFRTGTYDDNTGVIEPEVPVCIASAHELVAQARMIAPGALDGPEGWERGDSIDAFDAAMAEKRLELVNGEDNAS